MWVVRGQRCEGAEGRGQRAEALGPQREACDEGRVGGERREVQPKGPLSAGV